MVRPLRPHATGFRLLWVWNRLYLTTKGDHTSTQYGGFFHFNFGISLRTTQRATPKQDDKRPRHYGLKERKFTFEATFSLPLRRVLGS